MKQEVEVLRVLREPPLGKLVVEFRGNRYNNISEVAEENVRRFLLTAAGELVAFSGGYQMLVAEGVAPPVAPTAGQAAEGESLSEQQARFLASLEAGKVATVVEKKVPSILPGISKPNPTPSQALNPVGQIDAILQRYLAADPELADRSIHLRQHPAGGLQIDVDGQSYQRPREIEDQRIQMLIKKAVKEWESS
jgi:hypothetical protein